MAPRPASFSSRDNPTTYHLIGGWQHDGKRFLNLLRRESCVCAILCYVTRSKSAASFDSNIGYVVTLESKGHVEPCMMVEKSRL